MEKYEETLNKSLGMCKDAHSSFFSLQLHCLNNEKLNSTRQFSFSYKELKMKKCLYRVVYWDTYIIKQKCEEILNKK